MQWFRRRRSLFAGFILTSLIAGCSLVEFGYSQLDWLMVQQVERLVNQDARQRDRLKQDIADLIDWHCQTQMPEYLAFLDDLDGDLRGDTITYAAILAYSRRIEGDWYRVLERGSIGAGNLLASLSAVQIKALESGLKQRSDENELAIRSAAHRDISRDYAALATRQWRYWLGRLNAEQQQIIDGWSRAFQPLGSLGVTYRSGLRGQLHQLILDYRGNPNGLHDELLKMIDDIRHNPPANYAARIDANKHLSVEMVAGVIAAADTKQLEHMRRIAKRWRADLAGIVCR